MNHVPGAVFISHGGGPMPLLGDAGHREMVTCLKGLAANIRRPGAAVVVSAHWEEEAATITAGESPPLIYDYYGFPEESYEIMYPCSGERTANTSLQRTFVPLPIFATAKTGIA